MLQKASIFPIGSHHHYDESDGTVPTTKASTVFFFSYSVDYGCVVSVRSYEKTENCGMGMQTTDFDYWQICSIDENKSNLDATNCFAYRQTLRHCFRLKITKDRQ